MQFSHITHSSHHQERNSVLPKDDWFPMLLNPFSPFLLTPYMKQPLAPHTNPSLPPLPSPFIRAFLQAPALHLHLTHPFSFYVTESEGYALRVLGHQLGPSFAPVAYFKKLDHTIQGWTPCLWALATDKLLICKSKKLIFRSPITVFSPHHLFYLLTYKGL